MSTEKPFPSAPEGAYFPVLCSPSSLIPHRAFLSVKMHLYPCRYLLKSAASGLRAAGGQGQGMSVLFTCVFSVTRHRLASPSNRKLTRWRLPSASWKNFTRQGEAERPAGARTFPPSTALNGSSKPTFPPLLTISNERLPKKQTVPQTRDATLIILSVTVDSQNKIKTKNKTKNHCPCSWL